MKVEIFNGVDRKAVGKFANAVSIHENDGEITVRPKGIGGATVYTPDEWTEVVIGR